MPCGRWLVAVQREDGALVPIGDVTLKDGETREAPFTFPPP